MWYHYLLLAAGLYLVGSAIYGLVVGPRSVTSMAMSAVQIAIGGGIAYYGYTGIMTPVAPPLLPGVPTPGAMMGGLRKLFRK
jgi:hypothetical protein